MSNALQNIVDYLKDEKADYEMNPSENHIWLSVQKLVELSHTANLARKEWQQYPSKHIHEAHTHLWWSDLLALTRECEISNDAPSDSLTLEL